MVHPAISGDQKSVRGEKVKNERDKTIIMAYKSGHYTQNEIGEYFGISHTTVSRVMRQADVQLET